MEIERKNEQLWLQGFYMYDALAVALANAFGDKRHKKEKYLEKPIRILPLTEAEQKAEEEKERERAIAELNLWAKRWKSRNGN